MAEGNTSEPSIEEILASIRKIISDDDAEADDHQQQSAEPPEDEVLELTDVVEEEHTVEPEPFQDAIHPEPEPDPIHEPHYEEPTPPPVLPQAIPMNHNDSYSEPQSEDGGIITERAMAAASGAFAKLNADEPEPRTSGDGRTVEDITRELLRPMLRQWMDQNLPQIVERLVERELRKISRKAEDM